MKSFKITFDHSVYKPSSYYIFKEQQKFELNLDSKNLETVKETIKKEHNINPFYLKIIELP